MFKAELKLNTKCYDKDNQDFTGHLLCFQAQNERGTLLHYLILDKDLSLEEALENVTTDLNKFMDMFNKKEEVNSQV